MPQVCGIMDFMGASIEAKVRTAKAGRDYTRLKEAFGKAREELYAAIIAERRQDEKIEDITARVPFRQTQVNRILEAAGLTEKRAKPES
jgi:hypothetical protein